MLYNVKTKYGLVRGVQTTVENIVEFRGIPYAKPPVGEYRWRPPEEPVPWVGVRECSQYGHASVQPNRAEGNFYLREFYQHRFHKYPLDWSEDCLYLNIWTPAETPADKLPVFVWIHGGGYTQGYSHESRSNGEVMASNGIVVVSINYRLNIWGFFGHPELAAEQGGSCGNYSAQDQAAAIKWIYENIAGFGGDPENITIAGQSAGGFSVQNMSVTPLTKGMVKKTIMQSGTIGGDDYEWFFTSQDEVEKNGLNFQKFAGCANLAELRALSTDELFSFYLKYVAEGNPNFNTNCLDHKVFMKNPFESFAAGEEHVESVIAGATSTETQIMPFNSSLTKDNLKGFLAGVGPQLALMNEIEIQNDEDAVKIGNTWFAWYMNNASIALTDVMARHGKKAYSYSFAREVPGKDNPGPFHSACIWYMFGNLHNVQRPFTEGDFELEYNMNQYWANFAKTDNPNAEGLPEWKPVEAGNPLSIVLDVDDFEMKDYFADKAPGYNRLYQELVSKCK